MNELKKCPFCGCGRIFVAEYEYEDKPTHHKAECNECEAETGFKESKREAIAAWNRRANEQDENK